MASSNAQASFVRTFAPCAVARQQPGARQTAFRAVVDSCFAAALSTPFLKTMISKLSESAEVSNARVQERKGPTDEGARSLIWEWCHRLKDREAAVQAVKYRHLGETLMHVKYCLHDYLLKLLHFTW